MNLKILFIFSIVFTYTKNTEMVRFLKDEEDDYSRNPFLFAVVRKCSNLICPEPNTCADTSTCKCAKGFAHFIKPGIAQVNKNLCTYQQKDQLTAFLLQFFVFCAGQFYIGNLTSAIPQLAIISLLIAYVVLRLVTGLGNLSKQKEHISNWDYFFVSVSCLLSCAFGAWWLADVILFGMNKYKDSNGVLLQRW
jgi:hypothetical protein